MDQLVFSPKSLGSALRRRRKAKKMSQSDAGNAFKLDQSTISSIELGAQGTRLETLFRLLAALDLEMVIRSKDLIDVQDGDNW